MLTKMRIQPLTPSDLKMYNGGFDRSSVMSEVVEIPSLLYLFALLRTRKQTT